MTYLICPEMVLLWIDLAAAMCFEAVDMGLDLAALSWRPSSRHWDENTLSLALGHGAACSAGIVVSAEVYGSVERVKKLQSSYLQLRQALLIPAMGATAINMRSKNWRAIKGSLDRRIQHDCADALSKARTEADMLLAREPKPELMEHWKRLTDSRKVQIRTCRGGTD
jgi:hypothetical protein